MVRAGGGGGDGGGERGLDRGTGSGGGLGGSLHSVRGECLRGTKGSGVGCSRAVVAGMVAEPERACNGNQNPIIARRSADSGSIYTLDYPFAPQLGPFFGRISQLRQHLCRVLRKPRRRPSHYHLLSVVRHRRTHHPDFSRPGMLTYRISPSSPNLLFHLPQPPPSSAVQSPKIAHQNTPCHQQQIPPEHAQMFFVCC